jgi:hypothetical protein
MRLPGAGITLAAGRRERMGNMLMITALSNGIEQSKDIIWLSI